MVDTSLQCLARGVDLRATFRDAGFSTDPEREVFHTLKENALGNIRWVGMYSLHAWMHKREEFT